MIDWSSYGGQNLLQDVLGNLITVDSFAIEIDQIKSTLWQTIYKQWMIQELSAAQGEIQNIKGEIIQDISDRLPPFISQTPLNPGQGS
jgi:hypothetical protein|tara:strand:- start:56 stop:319 length:264 start_codon:yes stop_codon:yes gene_type:complete